MNQAAPVPLERNILPNLSGRAQQGTARRAHVDELSGPSRYELLLKIGSGGMASVYVGRASGSAGFSRLVAVKRAHAHLINDPASERMLITEAKLSSRLNHANVVAVQDVEHTGDELLLIMEYIEGASLTDLIAAGVAAGLPLPHRIAVRIALDACAGLAAVHELTSEDGRPLGFLHRDVSPQNILVGIDGTSRISDFGLAKALASTGQTFATNCSLKGKLAYLAPEVIDHGVFSVKSDLFALGVVTWEAIAKKRLFRGDSDADTIRRLGLMEPPRLSQVAPELGAHLDMVLQKSLEKDTARRYGSVREFAAALFTAARRADLIATSAEVSDYVRRVVGPELQRRREAFGESFQEPRRPAPPPIIIPAAAPSIDVTATLPRVPRAAPSAPTLVRKAPPPPPRPVKPAREEEVSIEISVADLEPIELEAEEPISVVAPAPIEVVVVAPAPLPAPEPEPEPEPEPALVAAPEPAPEPVSPPNPPTPFPPIFGGKGEENEERALPLPPENRGEGGRGVRGSRQWGGGAALAAMVCGGALAAGVFFAKPWTPGAGQRVSSFWHKTSAAVVTATAPARHRIAALVKPAPAPPAPAIQQVAAPEQRRVEAPIVADPAPEKAAPPKAAVISVASLPDKESANKPVVINVASLPDKESADKPVVINVASLPDKESADKPVVINVSSLPDKESAGKPVVINVASLPDK